MAGAEQTLKDLRDRSHPLHLALREAGPVAVLDLDEAKSLTRATLDTATVVIVATRQAFQVDDEECRKVYQSSGALMHHFDELDSGDEFECACWLAMQAQRGRLRFWVRNLVRHEGCSFFLQKAGGRFYPDFVALLPDGTVLVVEVKGGQGTAAQRGRQDDAGAASATRAAASAR